MIQQFILPAILMLLAGMAEGFFHASIFHTDKVIRKWGLNQKWWDYRISYMNKYKNGKETFRGKYFTFTTDSIHLFNFINHLCTFSCLSILVSLNYENYLWWHYTLVGISFWAINRIGFNIIWKLFK